MVATQIFLFAAPSGSPVFGMLWSLVGVGAAGIILCAIGFVSFENFLNTRGSQFLGKISFSLYLIHVPIIATLAYALGDAQWWLVGIIGIPLSIGAATVFHRYVEVPSQRLAKRVGERAARPRVERAPVEATGGFAMTAPIEEAPPVSYSSGPALPHYASMR